MRSHQSGFTLLEICIAIAIFAIGALTAMSILVPAVRWGGDAQKDLGGPEAALSAYQYLTSGGTLYKTTSNDTTDIFNGRTRAIPTPGATSSDEDVINAKHYPYVVVITDMMQSSISDRNNDWQSSTPPIISDIYIKNSDGNILGKLKPNVLLSGKYIRVYRKRQDPFANESGLPSFKQIDDSSTGANGVFATNATEYANIIDEDPEKPGAQPLFMMAVNLFRPE